MARPQLTPTRIAIVAACLVCLVLGHKLNELLHEKTYNWSQLSTDERHLQLHSEQAFYISYYFETVAAPDPFTAFFNLVSDTTSEHPYTINTLSRFNIYQEFVLGNIHRVLTIFASIDPYTTFMTAIWLLSGIQLAALFVVGYIFSGNLAGGAVTAASFLFNLNETTRVYSNPLLRETFALPFLWIQIGALFAALSHTATDVAEPTDATAAAAAAASTPNRDARKAGKTSAKGAKKATRAAAAAAKRRKAQEGSAFTAFVRRCWREASSACQAYPILAGATFLFTVTWQFAQFILFLETAALLAAHLLGYVNSRLLNRLLVTMVAAVLGVSVSMFLNTMLIGSLFLCFAGCILALQAYGVVLPQPGQPQPRFALGCRGVGARLWHGLCGTGAAFGSTLFVKALLSVVLTEDSHVFGLLKAKLSEYADFDTSMYLCGSAYGFLPQWAWDNLADSSLLWRMLIMAALVLIQIVADFVSGRRHGSPAVVFAFFLGIAFTMLGEAIMRLMLFMTPLFCVLSALMLSTDFWASLGSSLKSLVTCGGGGSGGGGGGDSSGKGGNSSAATGTKLGRRVLAGVVWLLVLPAVGGIMYQQGLPMLTAKIEDTTASTSQSGTSMEVIEWLRSYNRPQEAVASSLAFASTVKLMTGYKLAIHPHAEDAGMRERYRALYMVYGNYTEDAVYASLRPMKASLLIIPFKICDGKCSNGEGLWRTAALGAKDARSYAETFNNELRTASRMKLTEASWAPQHDQFCYSVTEVPLSKLVALYQNDHYLVLRIPAA